ncbi:MAG TPA: protein kinase, partial [Dermatophilaceae bacterium]|nr:protein kinase [Dermatophilaceae bacterium]
MTDDSSGSRTGPGRSPYIAVGTEIGSYRIEAYLDRGGMASIYEATDLRLTRKVALKVLTEELAEGSDFRERFLRESRFAASLDHPNIVPIYEAGEADGHLYIAMRYVRGNNLAEVLRKDGPFEPRRALAILSPVADALDAAHHSGLVHRDVKPANILLAAAAGRDGYEHVYLTDFGLTKATSALTKLTATGNFIGTMAYVAPEQIRGEPLDARTDLYAFGCVAYECLTGVPPFVRDDQAALLWAHLNEPPAAVSDHRGDLLPADPVMAKALAKNPSDRYRTCDEFTQALSDMLLTGRHSPSSVLTTATPQPGRVSAAETLAPSSASAIEASLPDDAQPAAAGRGQGPDEPPRRTEPPDDAQPVAAGQGARQQESPEVRRSQGGPQRPPTAGPPAVAARSGRPGRSRRPSRRAVLAAVAGLAAILTAVLVFRPTTQVGGGRPTEPPSSAESPSSATAASTQASASTDSAAPSSTEPPPVPAAPAVVPVASVAIPTIDGAPIPV